MSTSILITGASGFIGGRMVERLAELPELNITATGRRACDRFHSLPNVSYVQADLSSEIPEGKFDVCIHVAGLADDKSTYQQLHKANVEATQFLCNHLPTSTLMIFMSSPSVYAFADDRAQTEEMAKEEDTTNDYGLTKLMAEKVVEDKGFHSAYAIRPRAVYGPGDHTLRPRILKRIKGNKMTFPGPLSEKTSMTHVDNLCDAVILSLTQKKSGFHVYNIADSKPYKLSEVFSTLAKEEFPSKNIHLKTIPAKPIKWMISLAKALGITLELTHQSVDYVTKPAYLSIEKAISELGYIPKRNFFNSSR